MANRGAILPSRSDLAKRIRQLETALDRMFNRYRDDVSPNRIEDMERIYFEARWQKR